MCKREREMGDRDEKEQRDYVTMCQRGMCNP